MARFPVIEATNTSSTNTAGTSHTVALPTGIQSGDLILILMNIGSTAATLNAHADYSELLDENLAAGLKILYRWANGSETDPTFTSSASTRDATITLRISGAINPATRLPQIGTTAASTDPPSVTPSQGTQEYLAIAMVGASGEQLDNGTFVTGWPSGFGLANLMKTCGTAGTNLGGLIGCAAAQLQQSSAIDPGAFTVSDTGNRAQTIIVHPAVLVATETGSGIVDLAGSGAKPHTPVTYEKFGQATMGTKVPGEVYAKKNTGIAVLSANASEGQVSVESGAGILVATASGPKVKSGAVAKAGSAIASLSGTAASAETNVEAGTGIRGHAASGLLQRGGITKSGSGISAFSGGAADARVAVETGAGVLVRSGAGSATKSGTSVKSGVGISARSAAGARAVAYVEADAGGADAPEPPASEADHPANIVFRAGGVATKSGGVAKVGSGIAGFSASGADASTRVETGTGILSASVGGTKSIGGGTTYSKQQAGVASLSGSSTDSETKVETGPGVLSASGSGSHSTTRVKTGSGTAVFVGSGAKQTQLGARYEKAGTAIVVSTGAGTRQRILTRVGSGVLERAAQGRDVVQWSKGGLGTLTLAAEGKRAYGRVPGSLQISERLTVNVEITGARRAGLEAAERVKASVS